MKQFEVDEKKRLKFMLTQHKKHPKWKKRAWVRRMLLVFFLISSTWIGIVGYMQNSNRGISMFILGFTGMGLITIVPYIIYYFALRQTCRSGVDYKTKETLILTDSEFINTYLHINAKRYYKYQRDTTNIKEILLNILKYKELYIMSIMSFQIYMDIIKRYGIEITLKILLVQSVELEIKIIN